MTHFQYTKDIEIQLGKLKDFDILWHHDIQGADGTYFELFERYNYYYYTIISDVQLDHKKLLEHISTDDTTFILLFAGVGWEKVKLFSPSHNCYVDRYKLYIQAIVDKEMYHKNRLQKSAKEKFIKLLKRSKNQPVYNPYDMDGGMWD